MPSSVTEDVASDVVQRIRQQKERLHVSIGAVCNNNCIFCMEEDRDARYVNNSAMDAARVRWLLEEHRGAEEVCFTSGEPTTRSELPDFIRWAAELRYERISLMTNGRRLGHLPYAAALVQRGLNRIYISIHGHTRSLHEGQTRTPESFAQTVAGLQSVAKLKRFGVQLHTSTVVTKRNLPHLAEIYPFLRELGVDQVVFNVMQANGRANTFFAQLFPRYTDIAATFRAFLAQEQATSGQAEIPAFLVDIPLCVTEEIPDFNRGYVERYRHFDLDTEAVKDAPSAGAGPRRALKLVTRADLDAAERVKRAECAGCRYDGCCEGVWANYLSRYGWDEMAPVADNSRSVDA